MSPTDQKIRYILARAFDEAWANYYRTSGNGAISEESARPTLAKFLVAQAKEGTDEAALAAAGFEHLMSLAPTQGVAARFDAQFWSMRLDNATARFIPLARIKIASS